MSSNVCTINFACPSSSHLDPNRRFLPRPVSICPAMACHINVSPRRGEQLKNTVLPHLGRRAARWQNLSPQDDTLCVRKTHKMLKSITKFILPTRRGGKEDRLRVRGCNFTVFKEGTATHTFLLTHSRRKTASPHAIKIMAALSQQRAACSVPAAVRGGLGRDTFMTGGDMPGDTAP